MHPTVIIRAFRQALDDILTICKEEIGREVDMSNKDEMKKIVKSSIGTKFIKKWSDLACEMALSAVETVALESGDRKEIDIKRYAKVEKIPGGSLEESEVLKGVMVNKDVTHAKMRRRIENPRIILLDCPLEYKKGESMTNLEISGEADFTKLLQLEEEYVEKMCLEIIALKPDLVITEKGLSDLAQHYLVKANISAIRRVKKSDNNRIARACGATICNRTDELKESDVGTECGLFEIRKHGDEYFMYLVEWGGATEMALAHALTERSKSVVGVGQWAYRAIAKALEVIPRTLLQNCGANTIRVLTALRAKHAVAGNMTWGVDGDTGRLVDMKELGVWDPLSVKVQTYKTAIETAVLLLRIDDIVSGSKKGSEEGGGGRGGGPTMG
ncbi:T-complex protein 1 subunit gamma [Geodia barretti]|nr:T-complex protein 1 subunit gamma [Geodia barretti]